MIKTALTTLVLVASLGAASQVSAAVSPDGDTQMDERHCEFVAEFGGYRCAEQSLNASLATPNESNKKKTLKLIDYWNPNINLPKFP